MFRINLATRIYINTRQVRLWTITAIVLLAGILFVIVGNIAAKAGEIRRLSGEIAGIDEKFRTANRGVSEKEYKALLQRIAFANSVIDKKRYDWLALLDKLEGVVPEGVAITSVEPSTKDNSLSLPGIAVNFNSLKIFMERLEDSKYFTDVFLGTQTEATMPDKTKMINFTLTCKVAGK